MSKTNLTNGLPVLGRRGNTVFIRLPDELQVVIEGGCKCPYCKEHPGVAAKWDTLAVGQEKPTDGRTDYTWTVHMPDPRDAKG